MDIYIYGTSIERNFNGNYQTPTPEVKHCNAKADQECYGIPPSCNNRNYFIFERKRMLLEKTKKLFISYGLA